MTIQSITQEKKALDLIQKVEQGSFRPDNKEDTKQLQSMVDSGMIWNMQPSWQRFAKTMNDLGYIQFPGS